jgi:hypothetical protein
MILFHRTFEFYQDHKSEKRDSRFEDSTLKSATSDSTDPYLAARGNSNVEFLLMGLDMEMVKKSILTRS